MIINGVEFELIEQRKESSSIQYQVWQASCAYEGKETILKDIIEHLSNNKEIGIVSLEGINFKFKSVIGALVFRLHIVIAVRVTI